MWIHISLSIENQNLMVVSSIQYVLCTFETDWRLQVLLSGVQDPYVILGDFNIEWGDELAHFCKMLNVQAYEPQENWVTYCNCNDDWIGF